MAQEDRAPSEDQETHSPDRLTRGLVYLSFVLFVAMLALGADILSNGSGGLSGPKETATPLPPSAGSAAFPEGAQAAANATPVPVTPPPCVPPQDWVTHAVQEGDTLYTLAQRFDTDVETLKRVNCLKSDIIVLGRELFVPGPPAVTLVMATADASGRPVSPEDIRVNIPAGYLNILLLGSDRRSDSGTWRTDTMIVVTVDAERNVVRLLSIPRDLWVNIPGHGYDRINTADLWGELAHEGGGPDLVKQTIAQNLGIPIHYYVRVDFDGFMQIIDAIGGVDIDVECALEDIELTPGLQHMDGELALLYARSRITTSDFDRSRRQRKLLMALWEKGLSRDIIPRIPALWMAMNDAFETDIPLDQVVNLAYVGLQLRPNQIFSQSIGPWQVENWMTPEGAAVLLPRHDKIKELLDGFYGPIDFEFLERLNQTTVEVLNGSWYDHLDELAVTTLHWAGFQVTNGGMADSQDYVNTRLVVYNAEEDIAEIAAQQLDLLPTAVQYQPDSASPVDMRLVIGADYDPCADR
ncbi:MAG: LCP family protein [Anaerolineae bacterium]|jgi:LCP family protein required for cell wall assembly